MRLYQREHDTARGRWAVEALFARYDRRVYLWCLRLCGDHDRALDLAQEAMLTALRDLHGFQHRSRFATWLYAVTRHRGLRLLGRERLLPVTDDETTLHEIEDPAPRPDHDAERRDEEGWLRDTLADVLEPIETTVLLLRCEEGLPVSEITRLLNLSGASGARGVLQNARRKLRAALEKRRHAEGRAR